MRSYLTALNTSLPQIISISALTGSFSRIGLLAYRDYSGDLLEWSGWLHQDASGEGTSQSDLIAMAKYLKASSGGDRPEATNTAFAKAYELMRPGAKTIIFLYTDAPPHVNSTHMPRSSNSEAERQSLTKKDSYGNFGPPFVDWVSATNMLCRGKKKAQVFSILSRRIDHDAAAYYNFMSTMTGGSCVLLRDSSPQTIAKVTVEICLSWMGVENPPTTTSKDSDA